MIGTTSMKVRITMTEDMLGTLPGDPQIYKNYIASKAPDASTITDEIEAIGAAQVYDNKITVFPRDKEGNVCIYDYLIKGFLKNAAQTLSKVKGTEASKIKAFKKKVDNFVFVYPRLIPIGKPEDITICERPLRGSTPQGERVAISASESMAAPLTFEITIKLLSEDDMGLVRELLDYGEFNGLGQWHNSGKGRFTWEEITDSEEGPTQKKRGHKPVAKLGAD